MKSKKIFKAGVFYFVGNVFDKAIAFITVPIFTRLLTTSEFGIVSTYISCVGILSVIISLSVGNSVRAALIDFPEDEERYLSSVFCLGTIIAVILTIIICMMSYVLKFDYKELVLVGCMHAYANSIISTIQWKNIIKVEYIKRTLLQSIPNVLVVLLSVIFIVNMDSSKYKGRIWSYAIVYSIIAIIYVGYYLKKGRIAYSQKYWKYALSYSIPLIFHLLSQSVLSQIDRSMLSVLRSSEETGIYSIAYQFGMIPLAIATTLENLWIPFFNKKMEEEKWDDINKMTTPYISIMLFICMGLMFVSPEILRIITVAEYFSAERIVAPIILATFLIFLVSIMLDYEYYTKQTTKIASNTIVAAVINVILNLIFIPEGGGTAAAFTTVVSYGISLCLHCYFVNNSTKKILKFKFYLMPISIALIACWLTNYLIDKVIIRWSIAVFCGLFLLLSIKNSFIFSGNHE